MSKEKMFICKMDLDTYKQIPFEVRRLFISDRIIYDDYDEYKDDELFKVIYKKYKKSRKELEDYKYNKRHS
jgi:hypothetical protein